MEHAGQPPSPPARSHKAYDFVKPLHRSERQPTSRCERGSRRLRSYFTQPTQPKWFRSCDHGQAPLHQHQVRYRRPKPAALLRRARFHEAERTSAADNLAAVAAPRSKRQRNDPRAAPFHCTKVCSRSRRLRSYFAQPKGFRPAVPDTLFPSPQWTRSPTPKPAPLLIRRNISSNRSAVPRDDHVASRARFYEIVRTRAADNLTAVVTLPPQAAADQPASSVVSLLGSALVTSARGDHQSLTSEFRHLCIWSEPLIFLT